MSSKKIDLEALRKADDVDELLNSMTSPLEEVDLSLLRQHMSKIYDNIKYSTNMDVVASRSLAAQDFISEMLPYVIRLLNNAQAETKKQKGLAFLERSDEYCTKKDIKCTDSAKKAYVDIDENSLASIKREGGAKALYTYLSNRYQDMDNCHNYAKKMLGFDKAAEQKANAPRDVD